MRVRLIVAGLAAYAAACIPAYAYRGEEGAPDSGPDHAIAAGDADAGTKTGPEANADASTEGGLDASSPCPAGRGPAMVYIEAGAASYCIDTTEVTSAQMHRFLKTSTELDAPAFCSRYAAQRGALAGAYETEGPGLDAGLPSGISGWCYAHAFCRWAGKRLCGARGGVVGHEWVFACQNGELRSVYAYGDTYRAGICNTDREPATSMTEPVASRASCRGTSPPFDRVFDMNGNSPEYDDWYEPADGGYSHRFRGGWATTREASPCDRVDAREPERDDMTGPQTASPFRDRGFRCCSDPQ